MGRAREGQSKVAARRTGRQACTMTRPTGILAGLISAVVSVVPPLRAQVSVASPDGRNRLSVEILEGSLTWSLARDDRVLILPSRLGFRFRGAPPMEQGLQVRDSSRRSYDAWWTQPWGEVSRVREQYHELGPPCIV